MARTVLGGWEGKGFLAEEEVVGGITRSSAGADGSTCFNVRRSRSSLFPWVGSSVARYCRQAPAIKSKIRRLVIVGGCVRPFMIEGKTLPGTPGNQFTQRC
jgi:hypothetical protein